MFTEKWLHALEAILLTYITSVSSYEVKQIIGLLFGSFLQYHYLPKKNSRLFILILSSSIFLAVFLLDPIMNYYKIADDSFMRLPIIASSGFISTILLSTGLIWLPDQIKHKITDMLALKSKRSPPLDEGDYREDD